MGKDGQGGRFDRRRFLGRARSGAAALLVAPEALLDSSGRITALKQFDPSRPHDLAEDKGGAFADRILEEATNPGLKIGAARFSFNQNYEDGSLEMSLLLQGEPRMLRIISQEYEGNPRDPRDLFDGTYKSRVSSWHTSHPVTQLRVGDAVGIHVGAFDYDSDPADPATYKDLMAYRMRRIEDDPETGVARLRSGVYLGLLSFNPDQLKPEQRRDVVLS